MGRLRQIDEQDSVPPRIWQEADRQAAHATSSLGRGLMVLRGFRVGDSCLGNTALAERTGLAKATVSRLTQILTELGYLRYRSDIGKYELAPSVLALCYPYLGNMPVPNVARPYMLQLAKEAHANVGLGIQDGVNMVYVESASGEPMSGQRQRVGFSVPVALTAMGLGCIGGMDAERREVVLRHVKLTLPPREWRIVSKKVHEAVTQVHERGFYIGMGTLSPTTNMLGVPFTPDGGKTMMAFNCGGSSPLQTSDKLAQYGPKLVTLAATVRRELAEASTA